MIDLRSVRFRYPNAASDALREITWQAEAGSFSVIAGPSGSGKSTLLRVLNGLVPHLSGGHFGGSAEIAGYDIAHYGPRAMSRTTGFVFQDPDAQAVAATVEDEIAFSMEQLGVAPMIMRKRIEEMLDLLGLNPLRLRQMTTLSGGERQRIALAGALALQPPLLVLDEPTSQLDPWGAEDVIAGLATLNTDLGISIVIAEHRLDRLLPLLDELVWIEDGSATVHRSIEEIALALPDLHLPRLIQIARQIGVEPLPKTLKELKRSLNGWVPDHPAPVEAAVSGSLVVNARGIDVKMDDATLLSEVNFHGREGEIVAIMGRNGSGKTTLLRTLFGFIRPVRGEVTVAGLDMRRTDPAVLGTRASYLPQRSGSVLFNETVRAEIEFTRAHRPNSDWPEWVIETLGLTDLLERDPRDLSEGQRLRAALAAILVGDPKVVMLDEPTRGLDGHQKHQLAIVLRHLRDRGACVLLATHDVELAASLADRVVIMGNGSIVADGPPREVLSGSLAYSTLVNRLFGVGFLTLDDLPTDSESSITPLLMVVSKLTT